MKQDFWFQIPSRAPALGFCKEFRKFGAYWLAEISWFNNQKVFEKERKSKRKRVRERERERERER